MALPTWWKPSFGSPQCRDHARPLPRPAEQDVLQLRRPRAFAQPILEAITASWSRIQELGPFTADVWPYIAKEVNSTRRLRPSAAVFQPIG